MEPTHKKGIIFSLDGALATTIIIIMLINTTYYFETTQKESLSQLQLVRRGYDTLTLFDMFGNLENVINQLPINPSGTPIIPDDDTASGFTYALNVTRYLPPGYDMFVEVYDAHETICSGTCTIDETITATVTTAVLQNTGYHHVQVHIQPGGVSTFASPDISVTVVSSGETSLMTHLQCIPNPSLPTQCSGMMLTSKEPFFFTAGTTEDLEFTIVNGQGEEYNLKSFKILNDRAYIATTDPTEHTVPTDRFVGTGERWFGAFNGSTFEGMHLARFYIWLR